VNKKPDDKNREERDFGIFRNAAPRFNYNIVRGAFYHLFEKPKALNCATTVLNDLAICINVKFLAILL
jgi:hypothetical protein